MRMEHADGTQCSAEDVLPIVCELERELGADWPALHGAAERTASHWTQLTRELQDLCSSDASIVFFGSIARGEATEASDADWAYLIDGQADPNHFEAAQDIAGKISKIIGKPPGREGVFGNLIFSHDLIQHIGGEDDTNKNLTRRNLLLLESRPFGNSAAHGRTVSQVVHRYIAEDLNFIENDRQHYVPRFLLNDFARFWRTMAVDFAYKRKGRNSKGLAIRNIKLRMSRKLLFASGLISCFACELGMIQSDCPRPRRPSAEKCQQCLLPVLQNPPLDNLASAFLHAMGSAPSGSHTLIEESAAKAFAAYDNFIAILADAEKRKHLEDLDPTNFEEDSLFTEARTLSRHFRDALQSLFFDGSDHMNKLIRKYGVF